MATKGQEVIEALIALPHDQAITITTENKDKRNSVRASIYKAIKEKELTGIFIASKGNTLTISREKKKEVTFEVIPLKDDEKEEREKANTSKYWQEKIDQEGVALRQESEKVLENDSLSQEEKNEILEDLRIKAQKVINSFCKERNRLELKERSKVNILNKTIIAKDLLKDSENESESENEIDESLVLSYRDTMAEDMRQEMRKMKEELKMKGEL